MALFTDIPSPIRFGFIYIFFAHSSLIFLRLKDHIVADWLAINSLLKARFFVI